MPGCNGSLVEYHSVAITVGGFPVLTDLAGAQAGWLALPGLQALGLNPGADKSELAKQPELALAQTRLDACRCAGKQLQETT
jgi:hypothetical protein